MSNPENDEIDFLELSKVILKEKRTILLVSFVFFITSVLFTIFSQNTNRIDVHINLAKYTDLDIECDSNEDGLIFCDSQLPIDIYVYSDPVINAFNKKTSSLRKKFPTDSIDIIFSDDRNLFVTISSKSIENLTDINSEIINYLSFFDNQIFSMVIRSREHKLRYLVNRKYAIENQIEFNNTIDVEGNLIRDASALKSVSSKLNSMDINNDLDSYEDLFSLYNQLSNINTKNFNAISESLTNANNLTPIKMQIKSLEESLAEKSYERSIIVNEPKISSYKKNSIRNILASLLFGLFISITFILIRSSNKTLKN